MFSVEVKQFCKHKLRPKSKVSQACVAILEYKTDTQADSPHPTCCQPVGDI